MITADEIETLKMLSKCGDALGEAIKEIAILRTRIAGLEDDCNEYAETIWSDHDTTGGDFVPPYPDNPLTKERRAKGNGFTGKTVDSLEYAKCS